MAFATRQRLYWWQLSKGLAENHGIQFTISANKQYIGIKSISRLNNRIARITFSNTQDKTRDGGYQSGYKYTWARSKYE
jgi:type IV secretory pathway component VirB8